MDTTEQNTTKIKPTYLVLACGIGLASQGLKEAGFECKGAVDYAEVPRRSFEVNFPEVPFLQKSLREINAKMLCKHFNVRPRDLDLIQISTPCVGYSSTGTFEPFHVANELFFIAMYQALQLKPKTILFENVPGMRWEKMKVVFSIIIHFFNNLLGEYYDFKIREVNSNNYGDPQTRYRLLFMCVRRDIGEAAWPTNDKNLKAPVISDVLPDIDYMVSTNFGERVYQNNEAACTLTAHANITVGSAGIERKATPRELAKLMGLPDTFELVGTEEEQILGIGNGVTIGMMKGIAEFMKNNILNGHR